MASQCAEIAKANTEANKQRHEHWKPPKGSGLPALDVCHMMAAKADIDLNGIKYSIKKANTASQPMDVAIDGITYSVSMALTMYHVSASQHSVKLGLLVHRGPMVASSEMIAVLLRRWLALSTLRVLTTMWWKSDWWSWQEPQWSQIAALSSSSWTSTVCPCQKGPLHPLVSSDGTLWPDCGWEVKEGQKPTEDYHQWWFCIPSEY